MANTVSPAQVQKYLDNVTYPSTKQELVDAARSEGADQEVLDAMEQFPDKEYNSPIDVSSALGDTS